MVNRQPLAPNNRKNNRVSAFVGATAAYINYPKSLERQTVFSYLRTGKPVSQGAAGGGRIINKQ